MAEYIPKHMEEMVSAGIWIPQDRQSRRPMLREEQADLSLSRSVSFLFQLTPIFDTSYVVININNTYNTNIQPDNHDNI